VGGALIVPAAVAWTVRVSRKGGR